MGTRSLTHIKDGKATIATIYRQFDGYPTGMGAELKALVAGARLTNGFGLGDQLPATANGMGCLAAYVIGALKGGKIGEIYLEKPNTREVGEEYIYTLYPIKDRVGMKCAAFDGAVLYDGLASGFVPEKCEEQEIA